MIWKATQNAIRDLQLVARSEPNEEQPKEGLLLASMYASLRKQKCTVGVEAEYPKQQVVNDLVNRFHPEKMQAGSAHGTREWWSLGDQEVRAWVWEF